MSELLKGNYELENTEGLKTDARKEKKAVLDFEEKAMEKLGGSIAFVMKGSRFVWDDGDGQD